jgi:hypothetical protein
MTDPPPITQRDDGVLITGEALPLLYWAVLALIARRHRDGLATAAVFCLLAAAGHPCYWWRRA